MPQQLSAPGALVPVNDRIPPDRRPGGTTSSPQTDTGRRSHTFVMPVVRETPCPPVDRAGESDW
jgi:hypothetical protein